MYETDQFEARRNLALFHLKNSSPTKKQSLVLQAIADNPEEGDWLIGKAVGIPHDSVRRMRKRFGIRSVLDKKRLLSCMNCGNEEATLYPSIKRLLRDDNKRLNEGECIINLTGDEYNRYLEFKKQKDKEQDLKWEIR